MKKVISGSLYNTETARLIGRWHNGANNFAWCAEELYQTRAGKYFKYGEGGPRSQYSRHYGNTDTDGEMILPLTPTEARQFAEEKLTAEEYAAEFGEPEEASETRKAISATLPADVIDLLKAKKTETGMTIGELIEKACREAYK